MFSPPEMADEAVEALMSGDLDLYEQWVAELRLHGMSREQIDTLLTKAGLPASQSLVARA